MKGREAIFSSLRARQLAQSARPVRYKARADDSDLAEAFAKRISKQGVDVRMLDFVQSVPMAVLDILRRHNMAARIHIPPDSEVTQLDLPNLEILHEPPGAFDAAVTFASCAIAETGTLVYAAGKGMPASWHFRPLLEIAIVRANAFVAQLEDVLATLHAKGGLPCTLNLVSGPSLTGDIEQSREVGAHGPKFLAVLVLRS